MAQDWSAKETPDSICNKILRRVFPGAVICLHDGRGENGAPGRTIEALKKAIPLLKAQGYEIQKDRRKIWNSKVSQRSIKKYNGFISGFSTVGMFRYF